MDAKQKLLQIAKGMDETQRAVFAKLLPIYNAFFENLEAAKGNKEAVKAIVKFAIDGGLITESYAIDCAIDYSG